MTTDLVVGLGLGFDQVCNELGQYPCTTLVHPLALGGVDPYGSGLYEPLPFTGVTSPIVVDRVALSACLKRVNTDLGAPASALVFVGVVPDGSGKLDPTAATSTAALTALYHRLLLRDPTPSEIGHLQQLYRDIEAKGRPNPGQDWMTLSCFAIASSVESVFY
ncbi:MAG: hypothetical protein K1X89_07775 [Myxococcaceae bacterium]|nr:hypothetical protein [Myxococcaceae bacterium]